MDKLLKTTRFDIKGSIENAKRKQKAFRSWTLEADGQKFVWSNRRERVSAIRKGIPYSSLEVISKKINNPIKSTLKIVGVPQTTYNKKKSNHSLLDSRDSELVLRLTELIEFGIEVFNNENEKFQRWLNKPNLALGGIKPIEYLDTISGINEVEYCLNRIEHGNFA